MASSAVSVGMVISGKYKLTERLGGGGMGEVFRAEHQLAGRLVAIKLLRHDFAENADLTRRFFQEAQAVNKIRHPNIVDVLDAGFSESGPYVVMECLEGASLAAALSRAGRLDPKTAITVVLPMLDALDAAHRQGIVHRDLKPENVFLCATVNEVKVKLLDFGIAKVLSTSPEAAPQTNTGVVFGTPDYLSPEQARGDAQIDGRSDIFSVGTVLFELLTGRRPFEAPNAVATAYRIVHVDAPLLAQMGVSVDPRLQRILSVALAKNPRDRFSSAAAFADALAPLAGDGATRRDALRSLVDGVVAMQPTIAAPRPERSEPRAVVRESGSSRDPASAPSLSFEPSLPNPIRLEDSMPPSEDWSAPAPSPGVPKAPPAPIAQTLASNEYAVPLSPRREPAPISPLVATPGRAFARDSFPATPRAGVPAATPRVPSQPEWSSDREDRGSRPDISRPSIRDATPSSGAPRMTATTPVSGTLSAGRSLRWAPRPLLADARKGKVRGTLPRAVAAWIERGHGKAKRDEALALVAPSIAESYRGDAFNALVWYELESLHVFLEAATFALMFDDATPWRHLAKENFERDFATVFRPTTARASDPAGLLARFPASLQRLIDFGSARVVETGSSRTSVRIGGFEGATSALRHVLAGTIEGMLAGTPGLVVRMPHGAATFAPELELDVAWRDHR